MTASRELGGEMIVIFARDSRLFTLNEVGASIWKAADGRTPLEEIVEAVVCSEFEVASGVAAADVETFVQDLVQQGILIQSDAPVPQEGGGR
jgi:hypothetical protein